MKKFMLTSRIFLALIFLLAVYLIYNLWAAKQINEPHASMPPLAVAGTGDTRVTVLRGGAVILNGQASYDPDGGDIVNYRWLIIDAPHKDLKGKVVYDGPAVLAPEQTYTGQDLGTWTYELEVTDDEGQIHRDTKNVFVQAEVSSITEPIKKPAPEVSDLISEDMVLGLLVNGQAMAYPAKYVYPHGIINDVVGGEPVLIVFCEFCQTGLTKKRTVNNRVLTFETLGGTLAEENFKIKDLETDSVWQVVYGRAESGPLQGASMDDGDFIITTWQEWVSEHPDSLVLISR